MEAGYRIGREADDAIAPASEVHANLEALKVLDRALPALSPERAYHLGDLVGYGARHEECIHWAIANTRR